MAKTHEFFKTPLFFQFLQVQKGTPLVHTALQSQETDEPYRTAKPKVVRLPFWPTIHGYRTMNRDYYTLSLTVTFRKAVAVGYWRETGYEEHEALSHALNVNSEHANDQSTDFETSVEGLQNTSTELGRASEPIVNGRIGNSPDAGANG